MEFSLAISSSCAIMKHGNKNTVSGGGVVNSDPAGGGRSCHKNLRRGAKVLLRP